MKSRRALLLIAILLAQIFVVASFESVAWGGHQKTNLSDRAQYNYAEFLLDDGDFLGAAREFERFISFFPGSPYTSRAQFKTAESYIGAGMYAVAVELLDMFMKNFPDDPLAVEAELMLWTLAGEGATVEFSTAGVEVIMPAFSVSAQAQSVINPIEETLEEALIVDSGLHADTPVAEDNSAVTVTGLMEDVPLLESEKVALRPELSVPGGELRKSVRVEALPSLTIRVSAGSKAPMEAPVEIKDLPAMYPSASLPSEIEETSIQGYVTLEDNVVDATLEEVVADAEDSAVDVELKEVVAGSEDIAVDVTLEDNVAESEDNAPPLKAEMKEALANVPQLSSLPPQDNFFEADDAPLRAVQVMYFNGRSLDEIDDEMRVLASSGINTIILRVFHNDGDTIYPHIKTTGASPASGVYFKSIHSPVVSDMLAGLTERAHSHELRVFAWMTTRYADYGVEFRDDLACRGYDISSGDIVRCKGLDVFNEDVVERLSAIYAELALYDIDGILFQDDLVLRHTEGFGVHAAKKYMEETGRVLSPRALYNPKPEGEGVDYTPEFWKWASWKNKTLLGLAKELKRSVREVNPDIKFAINLMYEAVTNPGGGLAWLSQDLKKAKNIGFDYYSIMAYHRQMGDELGKSHGEIKEIIAELVTDAVEIIGEPGKVLIKFQTIDWNTSSLIPYGEVISLVRSVKRLNDVSLAVVPYKKGFPFYELTLDNDLVFLK